MSNKFSAFEFTDEGLKIISEVLANDGKMSIMSFYTFDKVITKQIEYNQIQANNPKQFKPVGTVAAKPNNTVEARLILDNLDVTSDYSLKSIAIVGQYNDTNFILGVIFTNEITTIPKYDGISGQSIALDVSFAISDTSIVTINTQLAGMLTVEDYVALMKYIDSKDNLKSDDDKVVHLFNDEEIDGVKKFIKTITGSITGNSGTTNRVNTLELNTSVDLNKISNGLYLATSLDKVTTNKPEGAGEVYVLVVESFEQRFIDLQTNKQYYRSINGSVFNKWERFFTVSEMNDLDKNIVHKTGNETVSGNKTFNGQVYVNNTIIPHQIELEGVDSPFIDFHAKKSPADFTSRLIDTGYGLISSTSNELGTKEQSIVIHVGTKNFPVDIDNMTGGSPALGGLGVSAKVIFGGGDYPYTGTLPDKAAQWSTLEFIAGVTTNNSVQRLTDTNGTGKIYTRVRASGQWSAWETLSQDSKAVHKNEDESIDGNKTFLKKIIGSITGTAGTAIRLLTGRNIKINLASTSAANFDGTSDVNPGVTGVLPVTNGGTGATNGNAPSASKLNPGRYLRTDLSSTNTAMFDGTSNVAPGVTGILPNANGGTGRNDGLTDPLVHGLATNADLNGATKAGFYNVSTNATAVTIKNSPVKYTFSLIVENNHADDNGNPEHVGAGVKQILSPYNMPDTYSRFNLSGTWSRWTRYLEDFPRSMSGHFSDIKTIITAMPDYGGRWSATNSQIANRPAGFTGYWVLDVIPGYNSGNGILIAHDYTQNIHSLATVNNGILAPWKAIGDDTNVVHKTGNETVAGNKIITGNTSINNTLNVQNIEVKGIDRAQIDFHGLNTTDDFTSRLLDKGTGLLAISNLESSHIQDLSIHLGTDEKPINVDTLVGGVPALEGNPGIHARVVFGGGTKPYTGTAPAGINMVYSILENLGGNVPAVRAQRWTNFTTNKTYTRTFSGGGGGSWSAWKTLAQNEDVVHKSGNETVSGDKTFSSSVFAPAVEIGNAKQEPFIDFHVMSNPSADYVYRIIAEENLGVYSTVASTSLRNALTLVKATDAIPINIDTMIGGNPRQTGVAIDATVISLGGTKPLMGTLPVGLTAYSILEHIGGSTANAIQRLTDTNTGIVYTRSMGGAKWQAWHAVAKDDLVLHKTGNESIDGTKKFLQRIDGSISGTAANATKLTSARTIGGVSFDGTANINLPGVNVAGNQSTTGNAATATRATSADKLTTARKINGVAFNGTGDITIADPNAVHKNAALSIKDYSATLFGAAGAIQFHVTDTGVGVVVAGALNKVPVSDGSKKTGAQIPAGVPLPPYDVRLPWATWSGITGVTKRTGFIGFFLLKKGSRDIYYKQQNTMENADKDYTPGSLGVDTSGWYPTH